MRTARDRRPPRPASCGPSLLALSVVATFCAAVTPTSALAANRCSAVKMRAVGVRARMVLGCHAAAAGRAQPVEAECLSNAAAKFDGLVSAAEQFADCATRGDAAALSALVDAFADEVIAALPPAADRPSRRCAAVKRRAAGRKAKGFAKCFAASARMRQAPAAACLQEVEDAFVARFADAEARGGCANTADAVAIEAVVDAVVADAATALIAICGDAMVGPGEACDGAVDDACPGDCTQTCACAIRCGNGVAQEPSEECDDGNTTDGDGCSATCQLETVSAVCAGVGAVVGSAITTELVATGLGAPVHATAPPLDPRRLFVVEQPGRIRVIRDDTLLSTPFLSIESKVGFGGERGLLSVAFHPNYEVNGRFFVDYTRPDGATVIARYEVSADPDRADAGSEVVLLTIDQPHPNHNGGQLAFGADGYLHVGMGDGGGAGDPDANAQNDDSLLGKLLRLDVDVETPPYYAVPPGNPGAERGAPLGLIWAKGLRNPWRFSFDRATDDLYIADVGQAKVEEIDYQAAPRVGGRNYGWDLFEGSNCFEPAPEPTCPSPPTGYTFPILEYPHPDGCSVTGGFVYRGCAMPDLHGTYFYADYCARWVRTFRVVESAGAPHVADHADVSAAFAGLANPTSFGEDARGEIYVLDKGGEMGGTVRRIVPAP